MKKSTLSLFCLFFITLSFGQYDQYKTLLYPEIGAKSVISADLDNDGDIDIISAASVMNSVTVYEKTQESGYMPENIHTLTSSANGVADLAIADLDQDSDLDIISLSQTDNKIAYYENLGNCEFGNQVVITTSISSLYRVYSEDMDNDGRMDLVISSQDYIDWIKNNGGWLFSTPIHIVNAPCNQIKIAIEDIDFDSDKDIICGGNQYLYGDLSRIMNLGNGTFSSLILVSNQCFGIKYLSIGDIDNDVDIDIITADYDGVHQLLNVGGNNFSAPTLVITASNCQYARMEDMDEDGDKDILLSVNVPNGPLDNKSLSWSRKDSTGAYSDHFSVIQSSMFEYYTTPLVGSISIDRADIDGDGKKDILTATSADHNISFFPNIADTTFGAQRMVSSSTDAVVNVLVSDFNNDGLEDIVSGSINDGKIALYKNRGNLKIGEQEILYNQLDALHTTGMIKLKAGDLDLDGDNDLVSFCSYYSSSGYNSSNLYWLENTGDSVWIKHTLFAPNSSGIDQGISCLQLADVDANGYLDIVVSHHLSGNILLYKNIGGIFNSYQLITSCYNVFSIVLKDMDGDNLPDLLTSSSTISWNKNLGNGLFSSATVLVSDVNNYENFIVADFNNDNLNDIVAANTSSYSLKYYENSGGMSFGNGVTLSIAGWFANNSLETADVDNDGWQDLVFCFGSTTYLVKNQGNGAFGPEEALTGTFSTTKLTFSDLDNDGDLELLNGGGYGWDSNIRLYVNNINAPGNISGVIFADMNQNGAVDSNEYGFSDAAVISTPHSDFSFSYPNGEYVLHLTDSIGTYTIKPRNVNYWELVTDSSEYHITLDANNPAQLIDRDFGYFPTQTIDFLRPDLIGDFPRCSQVINYWINVKNIGTTIPSGLIKLELDPLISFVSSVVPPDSTDGSQIFYWHYDSLIYFSHQQFAVQVQMPTFAYMGSQLNSYLTAFITDQSENLLASFTDTLSQVLVCAYDPNDKVVEPTGFDLPGYIPTTTDWLEYTVRFQNTGNDTALNIVILDQLDPSLDRQSLQPLAYSHPVIITVDENGLARYAFHNIQLPDSNANEIASHGFIRYRIKIDSNALAGTVIQNTANIYFDYNPAIVTNTTTNTLFDCPSTVSVNDVPETICEQTLLSLEATLPNQPVSVHWELNGSQTNDASFNWTVDTIGTFQLHHWLEAPGCSTIDTLYTIEVYDSPEVTLEAFTSDTICAQNEPIQLPFGQPSGGVYSGNGVLGTTFDPAAGNGLQTVYYTVTDGNSCIASDSIAIFVEDCLTVLELNNESLQVFPNPFGSVIQISTTFPESDHFSVRVFSSEGGLVLSNENLTGKTLTLVIPDVASGIYVIEISNGNSTFRKRLIKL